ncbi:MAG: CBS domain-containing protein [Hyphomicrobiaceae bacterium]
MQARDVMTKDLVTVGPDTTVGDIAALLVSHRIGAVPVVSGDRKLIGIVSQTDLVHRSETGTEKRRKWWLEAFADPDVKAREYVKSHGHKAQEVMTRVIVSVSEGASLAEVADVLDTHRIRQVPVVSDGRLAGMISRADLVRALAEVSITAPAARSDSGALQKAIWDQIKAQSWLKTAFVNLSVKDGVVDLWGAVDSDDQRRALAVLVKGVPGVVKVEDNVTLFPKVVAV